MIEEPYKPSNGYHFSFPDSILSQQQQHPLLNKLFVCRAGYFPQFTDHLTERPFGFDTSHILIYCTAGKGWLESTRQRWTISKGQLFFVLKDVPHAYGADETDPWTIHWLHFDGVETAVFLNLLQITMEYPLIQLGEKLTLMHIFHQIYDLCKLGYSLPLLLNCAALLRQIFCAILFEQAYGQSDNKRLDVTHVIQFMLANTSKLHSVETFATQANLSSSHFSRLFQQKTGYAPMDYFIRLKMQKASELLATTDLMVYQIGQQVGYDDAYYFSRLFKKIMGVSPRLYRKQRGTAV